jgi:predicted outer membrane lipoprotein
LPPEARASLAPLSALRTDLLDLFTLEGELLDRDLRFDQLALPGGPRSRAWCELIAHADLLLESARVLLASAFEVLEARALEAREAAQLRDRAAQELAKEFPPVESELDHSRLKVSAAVQAQALAALNREEAGVLTSERVSDPDASGLVVRKAPEPPRRKGLA